MSGYFRYPGQEFTEERFLNELCDRSGCAVLLDLHNLYTNAVNHKFNATTYLENLNLDHVVEIHIAGGVSMMGFHTDSHTGPVVDPVWQLLEQTVPRASNLMGRHLRIPRVLLRRSWRGRYPGTI